MKKIVSMTYESPEVEVILLTSEGVLCASNEILEEDMGLWE